MTSGAASTGADGSAGAAGAGDADGSGCWPAAARLALGAEELG
jgi:hypothetical protein